MTPRQHTIAFRTWQIAQPRGWDVTVREIAERLDESTKQVSSIVRMMGWQTRLRSTKTDGHHLYKELRRYAK